MIILGLGANLPSAIGPPATTLVAALVALGEAGVTVERRSPWYRSAPVPAGDQPWYINGVAEVATALAPEALLALLHRVEASFGRVRRTQNEARPLDLDILDYHDLVRDRPPVLPHPRLHLRAFVLLPLRDLAPDWRHPVTGEGLSEMIARLPADQLTERLGTDQ
jgi:2-amino-4-hydroxy-6-hydroxymethyldihydropteridine diphosphokinase